jgi:hypothetical protein
MQTRRQSLIETIAHTVRGLICSILLNFLWLHFDPLKSVGITVVFTSVSFITAYPVRRFFAWYWERRGRDVTA